MKLIDDLRRENLSHLRTELGGLRQLSERLEREDSQVSQWILGSKNSGTGKPRGMRSDTARFIEQRCGKPEGWLDQQHFAGDEPLMAAEARANYPTDGLKKTISNLSAYLQQLDVNDRTEALRMMGRLANEPDAHEKIALAIEGMASAAFAQAHKKAA